MTHRREALLVNRISLLFARDSRDLREKPDGWVVLRLKAEVFGTSNPDIRPSAFGLRTAPVAHDLLVSLTIHKQRGISQAGR